MKKYIRSAVADTANESTDVREHTARYSTRADELHQLINDPEEGVRIAAIYNPNTPIEDLVAKYKDKTDIYEVKSALVDRPDIPEDIQYDLAGSTLYTIYSDLANKPNTSQAVLTKLADHKDWRAAACVANNPSTPENILWKLSRRDDIGVRIALVYNPSTPDALLKKLLDDSNNDIRWVAKQELKRRGYKFKLSGGLE